MGHSWRYQNIEDNNPTHIMRIIYDTTKQKANLQIDNRVKFRFEELGGAHSIYLNAFLAHSEAKIDVSEEKGIIASHRLDGHKWAYFTLEAGPPQTLPPEPISGMVFHLEETRKADDSGETLLTNSTGIWYSVPENPGTLLLAEASWDVFKL